MPLYTSIAASTITVMILSTVVYRLLFHPLSSVPGPKLAAITRLWLAWHWRKGKNNIFQPSLHKYGPIVRISPNEVMVCSEEAVRAAYHAGSPFVKGKWYQVFAAPDSRRQGDDRFDLLTEMDKDRYRHQRRAIGPAYSIKGMEKHEDLLDGYLDKFVGKMNELSGQWIPLSEWMHIFALDALSTFTLGKTQDYTSKGHDGGNMEASDKHWAYCSVVGLFSWIVDLTQSIPKVGMFLMIPISLVFGLKVPTGLPIFSFVVPNTLSRLSKLESTANTKMPADWPGFELSTGDERGNGKAAVGPAEGEEADLLASLMKLHSLKGEKKFLPAWVLVMTITNFGAGLETLTITISACIYWLAQTPYAKDKLVKELRDAGIGPESKYGEIVKKVPYLTACMKEAMRLFPAISTSMPHVVPETGATLSSHYLPPGTVVGINPWALHHDPSIFADPESFIPERWISDGTEESKRAIGRLDACWLGFGGGSRSCPGQHMARFFVIKLIARLFSEMEVEVKGEPVFKGWFTCHFDGVDVRLKPKT